MPSTRVARPNPAGRSANSIDPELARALLDYDPMSGALYWRHSQGRQRKGTLAGTTHPAGYTRICLGGRLHFAHRIAWVIYYGSPAPDVIDHINGLRSDNRISNLRAATKSLNAANVQKPKRNKYGLAGVKKERNSNNYVARIRIKGKTQVIGRFTSAIEAHMAYRAASIEHYGEFSPFTDAQSPQEHEFAEALEALGLPA